MRVLVLGGASEASALATLLAARSDVEAIMSFAGRTKAPVAPPIPLRIGGFGGADGLAAYLAAERIDVLVDATHPFAEQISRNARIAAARANMPLIILSRPAWARETGDRWIEVPDMASAVGALGDKSRRVFLAIGRLQLAAFEAAPQHFYLIRSIDPVAPAFPHCRAIAARGPFDADAEERLLRDEMIDVIVAKNSGSPAVFGKILAARRLGLPVIMVERPYDALNAAHDPAEALDLILRHGARPALRGV
ncbi:Precorrin-6A reductase [Methylocella tundrae]|uniref:Precorrin-6A reductase n=1 Tax=Methylocella tundrae TaxID=227605 RepID=A0A8B6MA83_METTU|nr:cobalt-precorrin-6A reductase [Methylocella tundrae]VTZ27636.1 Precorrin-6A reductase [Methylocella tundrae]VTZ51802.1 Precorrin-6A reductase [Methylocella tundrae]